jgi:hypothetical protein
MILRTAALVLSAVLAYALLRGWPAALPGVMKACLAVLALVAGLGLWAKRGPRKEEIHARGRRVPQWTDYAVIGGALLAVECGFLWLLGAAPRPLESVALEIERHFRPEAAAMRVVNGGEQSRSGNWLWTAETRRPLPKRTDFKPGMKPEVFLRLQDPADAAGLLQSRVYVRAFALGRYENAAWAPLAGKPLDLKADDSGFVQLAAAATGRVIPHEVFHSSDPAGQNVFTALQGATAAGISPLTRVDDGLHLLPPATRVGGYQYFARSKPVRIEDLPDGEWVSAWPGAPDDLLALPESGDFTQRVRELARIAAGNGSVKEQLLHLQEHLRTSLDYSLETTNARDLDPIENFLFEEKRGHCEYFATAGALMARALGIPSRVAYGWAGGKWFEASGLFVFRANEAHSWTEVWLDRHGWVLMDPTPQSHGTGERAQVAGPGETLPTADEPVAETTDTAMTADSNLPLIALWLMVGFAVPAAVIALWRGKRRLREGGDPHDSADPGGPAAGYLASWRRACAVRGLTMPPGFTLRRQLERLPEKPDFAAELLDYHYATRYENRPADRHVEKSLARRIRGWEMEFSGIKDGPKSPIRAHE